MYIFQPSVTRWVQDNGLEPLWEHIARCAQVCYQTKGRENESGSDFVDRVIFRNLSYDEIAKNKDLQKELHLSVLEHGTVYLKFNSNVPDFTELFKFYIANEYSKIINVEHDYYITTNMRVIIENDRMSDMQYACDWTIYHEPRITYSIVTNIGAIRDLNRHRVHSISEESTRYCKYTSPKFGEGLTFVNLPWIDYDNIDGYVPNEIYVHENGEIVDHMTKWWNDLDWYFYCLEVIEITYKKLISLGWTAQQASNVLPFATKTQSVHTAFLSDWEHFIKLRCDEVSGKVRPEVKVIADDIKSNINFIKEHNAYEKKKFEEMGKEG